MAWDNLQRSKASGGLTWHRAGKGPPLLLIHGVGLRAEAWAGLLPILTSHYSVFAVDMPGHGESSSLPGDHSSLADYTGAIADALFEIEGPCIVGGHSMGALIALELASLHPEKVCGVVAFNSIYRRSAEAAKAVQARAFDLSKHAMPDASPTLERWFGIDPQGELRDAKEVCGMWLTDVDHAAYAAAYRVFAQSDGPSDEALAGLTCPSLFITGAEEPNSLPSMSQAMAALVPKGKAIVVDGAAHMAPMTHATDIAAHVLDFFAPA